MPTFMLIFLLESGFSGLKNSQDYVEAIIEIRYRNQILKLLVNQHIQIPNKSPDQNPENPQIL